MVSTEPALPVESADLETQSPPLKRATPSGLRRFFEWFWGGKAWHELREAERAVAASTQEHRRRARAALELGRAALESTGGGLEHGPFEAHACELFRQAIYWALLARQPGAAGKAEPAATLAQLWALGGSSLEAAAGDAQRRDGLKAALLEQDFVSLAELAVDEQIQLGRELAELAELVLSDDALTLRLERLWLKRLLRLSLPVLGLAALVIGILLSLQASEDSRDIARGKAWVASSKWPEGGCASPAQVCAESPDYFFSTTEEDNPWLEFDLGAKRSVSGILVKNRVEAGERAVPLVVEVSTDHFAWREVTRQSDEFKSFRKSFTKTQARWVRLRVARKSFLHLLRVKIFG